MLLADEAGASLIVAVACAFTLVEFLDKGRSGMASAVLTRIRVADKIVDAKGVSRLYQSRISTRRWSARARGAGDHGDRRHVAARGHGLPRLPRRGAEPAAALANWNLLVIDFRYHLVSIIAVFLALAVGIAVGANALRPTEAFLSKAASEVSKKNNSLTQQNAMLQQQINADQAFAQAGSTRLLAHLLTGQSAVLVTAPGADSRPSPA